MAKKFYTGIDAQNQLVQGVATPSASTDAANKAYVDGLVNGLDWKASVRAASTTNVTVSSPGTTLDGVTLANPNRILLKNQTAAAENGIYVWTASGAALTRAADATTGTFSADMSAYVEEGTVNADTAWTLTTNNPITLGTTSLTYTQVGAQVAYVAGNGLSLTGSTFAVVPGPGILADGTSTRIDSSVVMRRYAVTFGDGSATTYTITHSLGTLDVQVQLYLLSTGEQIETDIVRTSTSVVTVTFAVAPATNTIRAVVQG